MMGPVLTGSGKIWWQVMPARATRSAVDQVLNSRLLGVPCGPGYPLIRLQALGSGRYPLLSLPQIIELIFP